MPYCGLPDDVDGLLELEPEEVGLCVLRHLVEVESRSDGVRRGERRAHMPSDLFNRNRLEERFAREHAAELEIRIAEGWAWLVAERLVVRSLEDRYPKYAVSRRGRAAVASGEAEREFLASTRLPKEMLHPAIQRRSWPDYIRGDWSGAVLKAFHAVEVAVRSASGLGAEVYGVALMREAFKPDEGALTAPGDPRPEQEALAHLFAGAIGSYKNSNSHRHVELTAREAGEMLVLASHLLTIVDARARTRSDGAEDSREVEVKPVVNNGA